MIKYVLELLFVNFFMCFPIAVILWALSYINYKVLGKKIKYLLRFSIAFISVLLIDFCPHVWRSQRLVSGERRCCELCNEVQLKAPGKSWKVYKEGTLGPY